MRVFGWAKDSTAGKVKGSTKEKPRGWIRIRNKKKRGSYQQRREKRLTINKK
jgi:hypothetical protein